MLTRAEMIELFTLDRCKSSAARFDIKKLVWMNGEYIRRQPREVFATEFLSRVRAGGLSTEGADLAGIMEQMQIRTRFYSELPASCAYFFTDDYAFDPKGVEKRLKVEGVPELLEEVAGAYAALPLFDLQTAHEVLASMGEARGTGLGAMVHPVRVAVSGLTEGPGLFEMLSLLGRDKVCARLRSVAKRLRDGTL